MYQSDERGRLLIDESGEYIPREEYYLEGIHCSPFAFPMAAKQLERQYGKNRDPEEVNLQHFIVTFSPEDREKYLLDGELAQLLTREWVRQCFPGYIGVIGTHTDGHLGSGSIHCHVYLCTVRWREEPSLLQEPLKTPAGYKFAVSPGQYREVRMRLYSLFRRERLEDLDAYSRADRWISDGEFWARRRGQEALERKNGRIRENGEVPEETEFVTEKERIRRAVDACVRQCPETADFPDLLRNQFGVTVREEKDRWRYALNGEEKSYSGQTLGTRYRKDSVEKRLEALRQGKKDPFLVSPETHYEEYPLSRRDVPRVLEQQHIRDAAGLRAHLEKLRTGIGTLLGLYPKYRQIYADAFRNFCARRNELKRLRDPRRTERPISWKEYHEEMMRALKIRLQAREEAESLLTEARCMEKSLPYLEEVLPRLPERLEPEKQKTISRSVMDRDDR